MIVCVLKTNDNKINCVVSGGSRSVVGAVAAARNTMPTVQDEEESLCLLASDLQESQTPAPNPKKKTRENKVGDQKHYSNAHSDCDGEDCWDDDDDDDEDNQEASFLSQGTAEKAFFNVCKTNDEEEEEEDDCVEVVTSFDRVPQM